MKPDVYTPTFNRALIWYATNGFFARDLDADDHAFLEQVRERGNVACGSLAQISPTEAASFDYSRRPVLDEELEYWTTPWAVERGVPRRIGPIAKPTKLPRAPSEWMQRREESRAMAAAELAREQKAWEEKQAALGLERERRLLQTMLDDIEWENANPRKVAHRADGESLYLHDSPHYISPHERLKKARSRFYEPEWKREERAAKRRKRAERHEAERRESVVETSTEQMALLKTKILHVIREFPTGFRIYGSAYQSTAIHAWTPELLMRALRCDDREMMLRCCQEIVDEGHLRIGTYARLSPTEAA